MCNDKAETPNSSEGPDDEMILSIMPDVMRCLGNCSFFEELDDRLCPADKSKPAESCQGNLDISKSILRTHGFGDEDLGDIFDVLRAQGGFCDCEVLYNVAETNRLKAEYWQSRAAEHNSGSVGHSSE